MKSLSGTRMQRGSRECSADLQVKKGRSEDDGQMEVGEEVDSKKWMDQKKKELQKQLRDLEKLT